MPIEKKPYRKYEEDEQDSKRTVLPVSMNETEMVWLKEAKEVLNQYKDSTALKQLAEIGANVLHDKKTKYILDIVTHNKDKNMRSGMD